MYIILGLKDYMSDIMHDWFLNIKLKYYKYINREPKHIYYYFYKEGNLKHYILQRKYS
jgi:hypothetical protein